MPLQKSQTAKPLTRWTLPALLASGIFAGAMWVVPMPLSPSPVDELLTGEVSTGVRPSDRGNTQTPSQPTSSSGPVTYPDSEWLALAQSVTGVFTIPPYPQPPETRTAVVETHTETIAQQAMPAIPIYWTYAGIMTAENASNRAVITIAGVQRIVGINDELSTPELTDGSKV
ncbi:MAG: hypothetical protein AAGB34_11485, partial [Planctomycetota bacterium]